MAGARGAPTTGINVIDREYFKTLRDDPDHGLFVSGPIFNRSTGKLVVFLARRLTAADGQFLGVAFIGVEPRMLLLTSHTLTSTPGIFYSLFNDRGGLLIRHPKPEANPEIDRKINPSSQWYAVAKAGGGLYHSPGWFDDQPKYVAVRPLSNFPLVVNVAVTDRTALAKWRERAMVIGLGGALALGLISALAYVQFRLRNRLARSRVRAWLRAKQLKAQSEELDYVNKRLSLIHI